MIFATLRTAFGLFVGVFVSILLILSIEAAGQAVFPPPPGLDVDDPEAVDTYLRAMPAGALLFVWTAWIAGTFGGGVTAALVAGGRPRLLCSLIGGLVLVGTLANLWVLSHPTWFAVLSIVTVPLAAVGASRFSSRLLPTATHDA